MDALIAAVREYPTLYDASHPDYMKTKQKDQIWAKIARKLDCPDGTIVKEQWRKLRDCHRDCLRRQRRKKDHEGEDAVIKPWIYQKQMEFLLPNMGKRTSINNGESIVIDDYDYDYEEERTYHKAEMEYLAEKIRADFRTSEEKVVKSTKKKKRKSDEIPVTPKSDEMSKKRREPLTIPVDEDNEEPMQTDDALHQFFMAMYASTRNLPFISQLQVRKQIFEVVCRAEENNILHNLNT